MSEKKIYIYIELPKENTPVPCGLLEVVSHGRQSFSKFNYGRRYLDREDAIAIDPKTLPLHSSNINQEYITEEGFSIFGALRDVCPDSWGRFVITRALGKDLSDIELLLATGEERIGALSFGTDLTGPKRIFPNDMNLNLAELTEAVDIEYAEELARKLDKNRLEPLSQDEKKVARLIFRGSSIIGGARPKITAHLNGDLWVAKFSREDDRINIVKAEYATMKLAAMLGLNVPEIRLKKIGFKADERDIFLIKRFDRKLNNSRNSNNKKYHMISCLTALGAHESESHLKAYTDIAFELKRLSTQPKEDCRELYKRMIFNILVSNTDDHLKNHSLIYNESGWRLSPLYDVVPFPQGGETKMLALGVGSLGRIATLENAYTRAEEFYFDKEEAKTVARNMANFVRLNWEKLCREVAFSSADIEIISPCFR